MLPKREIKRLREAQNLLGLELARRMGVSPARISVLERDEHRGAVTLKMMARAAEALGCDFVYALLPREKRSGSKPRLKLQQDDSGELLDSRMRALLDKIDSP